MSTYNYYDEYGNYYDENDDNYYNNYQSYYGYNYNDKYYKKDHYYKNDQFYNNQNNRFKDQNTSTPLKSKIKSKQPVVEKQHFVLETPTNTPTNTKPGTILIAGSISIFKLKEGNTKLLEKMFEKTYRGWKVEVMTFEFKEATPSKDDLINSLDEIKKSIDGESIALACYFENIEQLKLFYSTLKTAKMNKFRVNIGILPLKDEKMLNKSEIKLHRYNKAEFAKYYICKSYNIYDIDQPWQQSVYEDNQAKFNDEKLMVQSLGKFIKNAIPKTTVNTCKIYHTKNFVITGLSGQTGDESQSKKSSDEN